MKLVSIALLLSPFIVSGADFEWKTASPESQGMSSASLESMKETLADKGTKALLVVRNDRIVLEWYSAGHSATKTHYTASMAKAIVGGLGLAVAMRRGRIHLDDPVSKYVPEWRTDPTKASITIRHLGSHTSGVENSVPKDEGGWKQEFWERHDPPRDPFTISRDSAPLLFPAGERFDYSNPGIAMLGYALTAALRESPEKNLRTLLREHVMRPIGIQDSDWSVGYGQTFDVDGLPLVAPWGGGGLTARAAARIGRLILRRGNWDGKGVLSPEHTRATTADAGLPGGNAMGWWTNGRGAFPELPRDAVYAFGAEHQILLIVPSLNLVAVRNGAALAPREPADAYEQARGKYVFDPLMRAITDVTPVEREAPYPPSEVIHGIDFDFATHRRLAPGSDNWQLTWADDGHQYAPWGDGGGFGGTNGDGRVSLGVARVEGPRNDYRGYNVWGGKNAENPATFEGKSWGIIAVNGALYMWVGPKSSLTDLHSESRLHRSTDHGATWQPASWSFTKADRLSVPTICQFGRDYEGARDGYVYHYFIDPVARFLFDHLPYGQVFLARTPKDRLMDREAYQFFAGLDWSGTPRWSTDIDAKQPAYEDPNGTGWNLAVSYNRGLGRYILTTEHVITSQGNLGMFEAPEPWGPWRTVAYLNTSAGTEFGRGHIAGNTFFWNIPTKWQSDDGRDVTVVFTGAGQGANNDSWNTVRARLSAGPFDKQDVLSAMKKVWAYQKEHARPRPDNNWIRGTFYAGVIAAYKATGDKDYLYDALTYGRENDFMVDTESRGSGANILTTAQTWLELYGLTKDPAMYRKVLKWVESGEPKSPTGRPDWYFESKRRYVDSLFTGPPALAMLANVVDEERAARFRRIMHSFFWDVTRELYDTETHLFYRDVRYMPPQLLAPLKPPMNGVYSDGRDHGDVPRPQGRFYENKVYSVSGSGGKVLWSRGNGWAFAGIARLLSELPKYDSRYDRYVRLFREIAAALRDRQTDAGFWPMNLVDPGDVPGTETSGTGFFTYGLLLGIHQGILDRDKYSPVARKGWRALFDSVSPEGKVQWGQPVGSAPYFVRQEDTEEFVWGIFLLAASQMIEELDQN